MCALLLGWSSATKQHSHYLLPVQISSQTGLLAPTLSRPYIVSELVAFSYPESFDV
jgi:hypothetical protein